MERLDPRGRSAIDLADDDGAAAAEMDNARLDIVGAEIDEAADRPLVADDPGDDELIEAVLGGNDVAVVGEMWRQSARRLASVLRLDREEYAPESALQLARQGGFRGYRERCQGTGDGEALRPHRRDVIAIAVDETRAVIEGGWA